MKTKKLYVVPETEIVEIEQHLMETVSITGDASSAGNLDWDDSGEDSGDDGW